MNAPQGLATFPGIDVLTGASITHSHGISPSVAIITTIPHTNFVPEVGELVFSFGGVKIKFPDCMVDTASLQVSTGGQKWTLRILDRRWKWKFGEISGRYNIRLDDETIEEGTEKTPQELAKLLLNAMGETVANISALPNKSRPEMAWDFTNPAQALASLCDSLSCRVVLDIDNRVYLRRVGEGAKLPVGGVEMNVGYGFKRNNRPDSIKIVGGPIVFQSRLLLEAVGEDAGGATKLLDDLSYIPTSMTPSGVSAKTWIYQNPTYLAGVEGSYIEDGEIKQNRDLAMKSVLKWYRIKSFSDGTLKEPFIGLLDSIDQILPLKGERIEKVQTVGEKTKHRPTSIDGIFVAGTDSLENTSTQTLYNGKFSIDIERGLVVFDEPVYRTDTSGGESVIRAAILFLTISYNVREKADQPHKRLTVERKLPGRPNGTGAMVINHPEIIFTVKQGLRPSGPFLVSNKNQVTKEAAHYLDAAEKEFDLEPSQDIQYAGLVPIRLDGAIQQVSWQVGGGPAVTRASRNEEHDKFLLSYERKRIVEKQQAALDRADKERATR